MRIHLNSGRAFVFVGSEKEMCDDDDDDEYNKIIQYKKQNSLEES